MMLFESRLADLPLRKFLAFAALIVTLLWTFESFANAQSASLQLMQAEEDALQAAADRVQASIVQVETFGGLQIVENATVADGPSTGTIVGAEGWIVTSLFQFRNDPASITVVLDNGSRKAAKLVARDHSREIGLLKIEVDALLRPVVPALQTSFQTGEWTIAMGKTFDPKNASRSVGILSAKKRIWDKAIQTDAKVSPFNYGGPLINLYGQTLGILAPIDPGIATEGEVQQWYDSGVGFAIPLTDILDRLPTLQAGTDIYHGLLGFRPASKDDFSKTVEIAGVVPGTPLAKAGFQKGDVITNINGQAITYVNQLRHVLGPLDAGQTAKVTVKRGENVIEQNVALVKELPVYSSPFFGALLAEKAEAKQLKIIEVAKDSPAYKAGLKPDDLLVAFAGEAIASAKQFATRLTFSDYRSTIKVTVKSGDEEQNRDVDIQLQSWSSIKDLATPSPVEAANDETMRADGVIDLPFADVPNSVFAFVPSGPTSRRPGLFIIAAEPGVTLDRKKFVDAWQDFAIQHDFIIAVVGSASPKAWSMEELEIIERAMIELDETYMLDPRRTVMGGFDAGGTVALVAAFQKADKFRALYFGSERPPGRMQLPAAEPETAIDLMVAEINPALEKFGQAAKKKGYRFDSLGAKISIDESPTSPAAKKLREFLATLAWY